MKSILDLGKKEAILAPTLEIALKICKKFDELGLTWANGDTYVDLHRWETHGTTTMYTNRGTLGDIRNLNDDWTFYNISELIDFQEDTDELKPRLENMSAIEESKLIKRSISKGTLVDPTHYLQNKLEYSLITFYNKQYIVKSSDLKNVYSHHDYFGSSQTGEKIHPLLTNKYKSCAVTGKYYDKSIMVELESGEWSLKNKAVSVHSLDGSITYILENTDNYDDLMLITLSSNIYGNRARARACDTVRNSIIDVNYLSNEPNVEFHSTYNTYVHTDDLYETRDTFEYRRQESQRNKLFNYGENGTKTHESYTSRSTFGIGIEVEKDDMPDFEFEDKFSLLDRGFSIERDSSVGGYELVTPIYDLESDSMFTHLETVRDLIDFKTEAEHCGGHINFSKRNTDSYDLLDMCKNFIPFLYAMYPNRLKIHYCEGKSFDGIKNGDKYQAIRVKPECIEFRLFPYIANVEQLKWRIELIRYLSKNLGNSFDFFMEDAKSGELNTILTQNRVYKNPEKLNKFLDRVISMYNRFDFTYNDLETRINTDLTENNEWIVVSDETAHLWQI